MDPTRIAHADYQIENLVKSVEYRVVGQLQSRDLAMTNRVHIDAPAGIIDLEGEKEFVEGMLGKLFPLIEAAGFGSRPREDGPKDTDEPDLADISNPEEDAETKRSRPRKPIKRAPSGHTCADRIRNLKMEGFFAEKRSVTDIVSGLKEKGFTHNANQVSAALSQIFKKNDIQRTKSKNGWSYFWDRN